MKILFKFIPWLILLASFAVPAYFYGSLPNEILIARGFFGGESVTAQKSLFTVFRVPLIEAVCAAAIEAMRRKAAAVNAKFTSMWTILLYAATLKSLFQSLETISAKDSAAALFFYLTVGIVVAGIAAALFAGREFFSKSARPARQLTVSEKAFLAFLLFAYISLAIVPILVYK